AVCNRAIGAFRSTGRPCRLPRRAGAYEDADCYRSPLRRVTRLPPARRGRATRRLRRSSGRERVTCWTKPMIVHLNGWPGAGKKTIGEALSMLLGARFIHNHLLPGGVRGEVAGGECPLFP